MQPVDSFPALVMTWHPNHVPEPGGPREPYWFGCNKGTKRGARAVIYEHASAGGRGIVAVCDFGEPVGLPHPTFGYAGWGQITHLAEPVSRAQLLADPVLAPVFRNLQGRPRRLADEHGRALAALIGSVPVLVPSRPPTDAELAEIDRRPWRPGEHNWANEAEIERALVGSRRAWRRIGGSNRPQAQVIVGPAHRIDLLGDDLVVEVKLDALATDIAQLHGYMAWLDANRPLSDGRSWRGVLVTGNPTPSPALLAAIGAANPAVELWSCEIPRFRLAGPRLRHVAG